MKNWSNLKQKHLLQLFLAQSISGDHGRVAPWILSKWVLELLRLVWLRSPMREPQDLPQVGHLKTVLVGADSEYFFLIIFLLFSAALVTWRVVTQHFCRS